MKPRYDKLDEMIAAGKPVDVAGMRKFGSYRVLDHDFRGIWYEHPAHQEHSLLKALVTAATLVLMATFKVLAIRHLPTSKVENGSVLRGCLTLWAAGLWEYMKMAASNFWRSLCWVIGLILPFGNRSG